MYTQEEAANYFREASDAATRPFIYLSAGFLQTSSEKNYALPANTGQSSLVFLADVQLGETAWKSMENRGKSLA